MNPLVVNQHVPQELLPKIEKACGYDIVFSEIKTYKN